MTSNQDKCSLSSLLPMSCRGHAEDFARRLHSRLSSLGSNDSNDTVDENSWLTAAENPVTLSQPRQNDIFFGLGNLESPGSPEDLNQSEVSQLINQDGLELSHSADCHCYASPNENHNNLFNGVTSTSYDSDSSDGPFYDTENGLYSHSVIPQIQNVVKSDQGLKSNKSEILCNKIIKNENNLTCFECESVNNKILLLTAADDDTFSNHIDIHPEITYENKFDFEEKISNDLGEEPSLVARNEDSDETYSSCLTIENKFTVECPDIILTADGAQLKPKESRENHIDDSEEDTEEIPRVRRCSSLKTGKTPPGTPRNKKIVRFADVLGLDLADVRTFLDEIPKIPNSAYTDLKDVDLNESTVDLNLNSTFNKFHGLNLGKILLPLFQQPGGQSNFIDRIRETQVCLDNALVQDPIALTIAGTVRVRNLDFHKTVHIRYTLDSWQSFADVQATYVENSCDGFSDKFTFVLFAHTLSIGQNLEFAIRFQCKGCQYWDNNSGINYIFQCLPATNNTVSPPITEAENLGANFYY